MRSLPLAGATDVTVTLGKNRLLDDVTLPLHAGRVHALVGMSGAGKTTLARALAGHLPERARVDGDLWGQHHVSLIPQNPADTFTPVRKVAPQLREIPRPAGAPTVEQALAAAGLSPNAANRFPHQLSVGMAQRCAIAAALLTNRSVLIADEPTSALDLEHADTVYRLLRTIAEQGKAVLLVTHDLRAVVRSGHCDTITVMERGRVIDQGPIPDVLVRESTPGVQELFAAAGVMPDA